MGEKLSVDILASKGDGSMGCNLKAPRCNFGPQTNYSG
jgi:hypothetical protein